MFLKQKKNVFTNLQHFYIQKWAITNLHKSVPPPLSSMTCQHLFILGVAFERFQNTRQPAMSVQLFINQPFLPFLRAPL